MKKLSQQIIEKISDFEIESDVSLPGFALEKDYFVLEAITLIQGLPPSPDFVLSFAAALAYQKPTAFCIACQRMLTSKSFRLSYQQNYLKVLLGENLVRLLRT